MREWIQIHGKEVLTATAFIIAAALLSVPFGKILSGVPSSNAKSDLFRICTDAAETAQVSVRNIDKGKIMMLGRNSSLHGSTKGFALIWTTEQNDEVYCSVYQRKRKIRLEAFRVNKLDKTQHIRREERKN